ncbi:hypothetical protein TNCV_2979891 [Trichonephila clavipes]|nr:hypothetical protein TNCV_2979891 [Trichonephila clavipes]
MQKSAGPKALGMVSEEITGAGGSGGTFPPLNSIPKIVKVEIGGVAIYHKEVQAFSGSGNFHSYPTGRTQQQQPLLYSEILCLHKLLELIVSCL